MSKLFSPDYLAAVSAKLGLSPSKKYGQNFLLDPTVIERMIAAAELNQSDTVIEVGPGFGTLTRELCRAAGRVVAFEIERKLSPYWHSAWAECPNLQIIWGNALVQIKEFFKKNGDSLQGFKVVANVPYQITSPLLRLFLEGDMPNERIVCMVQKEVAERVTAPPGQMSLLSVSVQAFGKAEYLFTVPRTAFWPVPAVDSAVVCIRALAEKPNAAVNEKLFRLARAGFASRRKLLVKNLAPLFGGKEAVLSAMKNAGIPPLVRAQELSMEEWGRLIGILFR